jgi:hypothetical protein
MSTRRAIACVIALAAGGCTPGEIIGPRDTGLDGMMLTKIEPPLALPGTRLVLSGQNFVDEQLGSTRLRLRGMVGAAPLDHAFDVVYVSPSRIEVPVDAAFVDGVGGTLDGDLQADATLEVLSTVDTKVHATPPLTVELQLAETSEPGLDQVGDGVSFVNQPIDVVGTGFLLGGDEGETRAILSGCFTPAGASACGPMVSVEIPGKPKTAFDRTSLTFPYATSVSGIGPGSFVGTLGLVNVHASGARVTTPTTKVRFDIQRPTIFRASTTQASLGQYVVIQGGGFVGDVMKNEVTLLALKGSFAPASPAGAAARAIDLELVPQFVEGPTVRYVLDEHDPLGMIVDLRKESGTITGTVQPIVESGATRVDGDPIPVRLDVRPVKQVLYVNFLASYVDSLRKFGLRAADPLIRARVFAVARRDYAGVNMEFREAVPDDFALYAQVDIAGPDPNGQGLFGYDNTPGKDTGNERLYDRIGGVNAVTQQDGMAGYGGVFTESFFGFSKHPNGLAMALDVEDTPFDAIFDPFRPDLGGRELTASELSIASPPTLADGAGCPAKRNRVQQIACAVWVLGNLIGTTMTHEVGHSLGLANPYGEGFHDPGDLPNRLMEAGGDRPFNERAELMGEGPAVFCDDEFTYLRTILPSTVPPPMVDRATCN